jgi:hypothetical protein
MTQAISSYSPTTFAGELAALSVENETQQTETDRLQRDAAREAFVADSAKEVAAMHAAADATATGAWASAGFSVAGGALAFVATATSGSTSCDLTASSKVAQDLAAPANAVLGERAAGHEKANAKEAETMAEQDKWRLSDASSEIDKTSQQGGKILDAVQSIIQQQNSATVSLINRI